MAIAADFTAALNYTLKIEGGYTRDTDDPETNFGLIAEDLKEYLEGGGKLPSGINIRSLTLPLASDIYKRLYWRYDDIMDRDVATKLFDMAVNVGRGTAARLVQQALVRCGVNVMVDSKWGPNTVKAVNSVQPTLLLMELRNGLQLHYTRIVQAKPEKAKFLHGWLLRADRMPSELELRVCRTSSC